MAGRENGLDRRIRFSFVSVSQTTTLPITKVLTCMYVTLCAGTGSRSQKLEYRKKNNENYEDNKSVSQTLVCGFVA